MSPRSTWLIGILATCALVSGCGSADALPSLPAAIYEGPITSRISYANAGVILDVPSSTDGVMSWSEVYTDNCTSGDALCHLGKAPTINLAVATTTNAGEAKGDGSIEPLMQGTLVYVIKWTDVACTPPVGPPGRIEPSAPANTCTILNFVDARSGGVLYSVEGQNL